MLPVLRRRCETEKDECVQSWIVGNADSENKQIVNLKCVFIFLLSIKPYLQATLLRLHISKHMKNFNK